MKLAIWLLLARCTACIALRGAAVMRACVSRRGAVAAASAACATLVSSAPAWGVFDTRSAGGLSKKYADTGVVRKERVDVLDAPAADAMRRLGAADEKSADGTTRIVAELVAPKSGRPMRVAFDSPWSSTGTKGVEARDLRTGDSAFVVIAPAAAALERAALDAVFASSGKYGSYGAPIDVRVRSRAPLDDAGVLLEVTFTALTPAQREVERRALIAVRPLENEALAMLVSGSTQVRWKVAEPDVRTAVSSFRARLL